MKKFSLTAMLLASVAFLSACGGGGGGGSSGSTGGGGNTGSGSGVINASTEVPANNVAGKPVTVVGVVVSNNTLLDTMNWSFQGSTPSIVSPELTNADCTQVAKTDNPAYKGNSTWRCTLTFTPSVDQATDVTYNFRVSGTNKGGFSASAQASVVVKSTASSGTGGGTSNGITVNFSSVPPAATAGQLINVTATADSTQGLLNTMVWSVSGGDANVTPTLLNQDCASIAKTDNPSGTGSSSWQCTLGLVVPTTLPANTSYKLTMTATNKNGMSNFNSVPLNVGAVTSTSPTIQVTFDPVPTNLEAGQIITLNGQVQTNGSKLTDMVWTLNSANAITANVSPQYFNQNCTNAAKQVGTNSSLWACALQLIVPTTLVGKANYTMALTGKTDSGLSNFGLITIPVSEQTNLFKLNTSLRLLNTTTVKSGDTVNLRCNATGGRPFLFFDSTGQSGANYVYQWVIADSQGLPLDLKYNGMGLIPLVGNYQDNTFVAPTVTQPTTVTVACRATDNITGFTTTNGVTTITYLGTSPFQNTAFGTIGAFYTIPDSVFAISSNTLQITINP